MKRKKTLFLILSFLISSCSFNLDNIFKNSNSESSQYSSLESSELESSILESSESSFISSEITDSSEIIEENGIIENYMFDNFQIHFMELGVYNTGDSTYIKAGDLDILIDAGAKEASAETIISYVNKYCTDGKLEYVITTHAHTDHFTGMFGNSKKTLNYKGEEIDRTGILYYYDVGTIIDFSLTNSKSTAATTNYGKYLAAVDYAVSKGATHYSAAQCFNEQDGAQKQYVLDESNNITMNILYNKYYFENSSDENNYSVCTLFSYNDLNFLLTGDLEKSGEEALANYYDGSSEDKTLPHCKLFKAGHHGSKTSSNDILLSKITPEICCICCCAGGSEYTNNSDNTFPTQDFIDRIAKYTDRVYATSYIDEIETRETNNFVFKPLNGTITVSSNGIGIGLMATNNLIKLKDSEWFNEFVYLDDNGFICSGKGKKDFYTIDSPDVIGVPRRVWPNYEETA